MSDPVTMKLVEYPQDATSAKLVRGVLSVLPGAPDFPHYNSTDDAVRALKPDASDALILEARRLTADDAVQDVVWMANILDSADKGYAVFTGLKTVWSLFNRKADALELDEEQRNDAIAKALALSYMAYKAAPGTMTQKPGQFMELPAGQAMMYYFGAIEIALPFADNLASSTGSWLDAVLGNRVDSQMSRLASLAGGRDLSAAPGMLNALKGNLENIVGVTAKNVDKIAGAATPYLPGVMGGMDKAAGVAATAADVMPIYRLLGARLAAESAAMRAIQGA